MKTKKNNKQIKKICVNCFYEQNPRSEACLNCSEKFDKFIGKNSKEAKKILKKEKQFSEKFRKSLENNEYVTKIKGKVKTIHPEKKIIEYIKDKFEVMKNTIKQLEKENEQLKKGKNKKIKETMSSMRNFSLLQLSNKEERELYRFKDEHYKKCKNSGYYIYELIGTGIGTEIKVKCPFCGKEKDITDTETW